MSDIDDGRLHDLLVIRVLEDENSYQMQVEFCLDLNRSIGLRNCLINTLYTVANELMKGGEIFGRDKRNIHLN